VLVDGRPEVPSWGCARSLQRDARARRAVSPPPTTTAALAAPVRSSSLAGTDRVLAAVLVTAAEVAVRTLHRCAAPVRPAGASCGPGRRPRLLAAAPSADRPHPPPAPLTLDAAAGGPSWPTRAPAAVVA
jgi:hypothetical protein